MGQEGGKGIKDNSDFELGGPDGRAEEEEGETGDGLLPKDRKEHIDVSQLCMSMCMTHMWKCVMDGWARGTRSNLEPRMRDHSHRGCHHRSG